MSCIAVSPSFRLLDHLVGWDAADSQGLFGLQASTGLVLAPLEETLGAVSLGSVSPYLPPAWLARDCDWYLVTPAPPKSRLLHLGPCDTQWRWVWPGDCPPDPLCDAVAVAALGHRVAVADRALGEIRAWARGGRRLVFSIPLQEPGPLAFTLAGELLVAVPGETRLRRYDPSGFPLEAWPALLPEQGEVDRFAVDEGRAIWLLTRESGPVYRLWRAGPEDAAFSRATAAELAEAFSERPLIEGDNGFCIQRTNCGRQAFHCFDRFGRPLERESLRLPQQAGREEMGQLLTLPLDSGIPRCRWHRIRLDADIPAGTRLQAAVATSEAPDGDPQGSNAPPWQAFAAGIPHPSDWQDAPEGALDFLVDRPPGRYLTLRLRLAGDGMATPLIRRVRLDFPRSTSLDFLPSVYRKTPESEDFSERFLSLFDAAIEDVDRCISRFPALLDVGGVPAEVLPWLGRFLDVAMDPAWDVERRRRILAAAPGLYPKRGTPAGLTEAVALVFDVTPGIRELGPERAFGALGRETRLRGFRLFGQGRARFRLGSSSLSKTPIRGFGNPDHDAQVQGSNRIIVSIPPGAVTGDDDRRRLARLINDQKPAHLIADIQFGGLGFSVGAGSTLGIDTAFLPFPAPVLGRDGNVRLGRQTILWPGANNPNPGMAVGTTTVVKRGALFE